MVELNAYFILMRKRITNTFIDQGAVCLEKDVVSGFQNNDYLS